MHETDHGGIPHGDSRLRKSPHFPTLAEAAERQRLLVQSRITVLARISLAVFGLGLISTFMHGDPMVDKIAMVVGGTGFLACCFHFMFTDPTDHWKR
jgi:hypothetical protein